MKQRDLEKLAIIGIGIAIVLGIKEVIPIPNAPQKPGEFPGALFAGLFKGKEEIHVTKQNAREENSP